jgi:hypothetical protein
MMQPTEQDFLDDIKDHTLTIIRNEGVYRHLQFKNPSTDNLGFSLITWKGNLCYTGDMGTYVFSRIPDMFEFFRSERTYPLGNTKLFINPNYWSQKVVSTDRCAGLVEFSDEKFKRAVISRLVYWIRENKDNTTEKERRTLWGHVISTVIDADSDKLGCRKSIALHDFSYYVNNSVGTFGFTDFWENDLEDYTYSFIWCCYAIYWGIQQFDNSTSSQN